MADTNSTATDSAAQDSADQDSADQDSAAQQAPGLTVALDLPSARVLADQACVVQDLQFVMDCCMRLLTELDSPEQDRDEVVSLALWSAALLAYGRCFGADGGAGLTGEDVKTVPLPGAVVKFHDWVMGERARLAEHPADPFEEAKIGATLAPAGAKRRGAEGVAVFATSRVLIDATGVRQLGGLASQLAKQTAVRAQEQQDTLLADVRKLDPGRLYAAPQLLAEPSDEEPAS